MGLFCQLSISSQRAFSHRCLTLTDSRSKLSSIYSHCADKTPFFRRQVLLTSRHMMLIHICNNNESKLNWKEGEEVYRTVWSRKGEGGMIYLYSPKVIFTKADVNVDEHSRERNLIWQPPEEKCSQNLIFSQWSLREWKRSLGFIREDEAAGVPLDPECKWASLQASSCINY